MQVFADLIFSRISKAKWLELDYEDIEAIVKLLEEADNNYYRSLAVKMKGFCTVILTSNRDDE